MHQTSLLFATQYTCVSHPLELFKTLLILKTWLLQATERFFLYLQSKAWVSRPLDTPPDVQSVFSGCCRQEKRANKYIILQALLSTKSENSPFCGQDWVRVHGKHTCLWGPGEPNTCNQGPQKASWASHQSGLVSCRSSNNWRIGLCCCIF